MDSGDGRREMDDYSFFLSGTPDPVVSSILKDFLSNPNINSFDQENNAHNSTFCLLNKASIIHSIRKQTATRSVPEVILGSLQIIEQLDRQQGLPISDSMREAFCAVAVHCTLTSLPLSWACYFDAVQRIWRFRIRNLEDSETSKLVGPSLRIWRDDLEAALWDAGTSRRLLKINTLDEALFRISVYLEEACSSMKPAFLALASSTRPTINRQASPRCCSTYNVNPSTLPAGVTDPLLQALEVAESVASNTARKKLHTEDIVDKDKGVPATSINPTPDILATDSTQAKRIAPVEEDNSNMDNSKMKGDFKDREKLAW